MKKRIMAGMLAMAILVTACNVQKANGQVSNTNAVDSPKEQELARGFKLKIDGEIGPMFLEKIDTSKQSVHTDLVRELSSEMTKGDDGSCYYFRKEGKGKKLKLVFYKNNGIKVCETTMEESIKKKYYIRSFVKYGSRFFLAFDRRGYDDYDDGILTTIDMETGEWGNIIEAPEFYWDMMVYEDCFYCKDVNDNITRYDLSGERTELEKVASKKFTQSIQCIVDGKIYYVVDKCEHAYDKTKVKVMRSNLDGSDIETLFTYNSEWGGLAYVEGDLQIDGDYMYLKGKFGKVRCLARIPLYGGRVEKIAAKTGSYELSEDGIFFRKGNYIYKLNKNLRGKPKDVTKLYYPASLTIYADPWHYADGHLMMQGYNKKEHKVVDDILHDISWDWDIYIDVKETYADDYYWVNKNGKVEDVIEGSGI